jgi:hypothetical protein
MSKLEINVGDTFGRLTILKEVDAYIIPSTGKKHRRFLCKCDCGSEKIIRLCLMKNGHTKSCGCLQKEIVSVYNTTYGLRNHPLYDTWAGMFKRCRAKQGTKDWEWYGKHNIIVCDRWSGKDGFKNFLEDMGNKPAPEYSIDRINPYGNYKPSNCRWADWETQANNKRKKG